MRTSWYIVKDRLDRTSGIPLYKQIAEALRSAITSGYYSPGVALPSERKLMEEFDVTRATIRNALSELRTDGLVIMERGAGAFVRKAPPVRRVVGPERFARRDRDLGKGAYLAEMDKGGRRAEVEVLNIERTKAEDEVAEKLGIPAGTDVVSRYRRYLSDGWPLELATSYIPWSLARSTRIARADTGPGGVYARLEEAGHAIEAFEEEIRARMPTPEERRLLQIPAGVPVIRLLRRALGADGRALEICDTIMPADRYVLVYPFQAG